MVKMKKEKGITLVSIVVTIIVLLILSGVVLLILFNTGIIDRARQAKEEQIKSQEKEVIKLAYTQCKMRYIKDREPIDLDNFSTAMKKNEKKTTVDSATDEESQQRRNSCRRQKKYGICKSYF